MYGFYTAVLTSRYSSRRQTQLSALFFTSSKSNFESEKWWACRAPDPKGPSSNPSVWLPQPQNCGIDPDRSSNKH